MSDTQESLRRKIGGATEIESVVRTMKVMAASSIGQYERAVGSLADYYRAVELGLAACISNTGVQGFAGGAGRNDTGAIGAVVFGSDQGLVGQFNDVLADFAVKTLQAQPGRKNVWAVGERIHLRLTDAGLSPLGLFAVPNSVSAITPLVGQILIESEAHREQGEIAQIFLFHNRPVAGAIYAPVSQRLLPLDKQWCSNLASLPWPSVNLPEVIGGNEAMLFTLVREYLFVSLFRACAESLASENASRLAAMQRAEININELLEDLQRTFHRLRQGSIDAELFDVISGFEALSLELARK